jgi:hypothetical protein
VISLDNDTFKIRALKVHGNKYQYDAVGEHRVHDKIEILWPTHGIFTQRSYSHLQVLGCINCRKQSQFLTKPEFVQRAQVVHGNTYTYNEVNYVHNRQKVLIGCKTHGPFLQTPNMHVSARQGCPKCHFSAGKYKQWMFDADQNLASQSALIYLVKLNVNSRTYNKVGITKRSLRLRYGGVDHEIIISHNTTLLKAWSAEQQMLSTFATYRQSERLPFSGWSEVLNVDIQIIERSLHGLIG